MQGVINVRKTLIYPIFRRYKTPNHRFGLYHDLLYIHRPNSRRNRTPRVLSRVLRMEIPLFWNAGDYVARLQELRELDVEVLHWRRRVVLAERRIQFPAPQPHRSILEHAPNGGREGVVVQRVECLLLHTPKGIPRPVSCSRVSSGISDVRLPA